MEGSDQRGWWVADARFEKSASRVEECPDPDLPEVAFAGRSNVGKSSLINALTGRRGLARVSRTPGRTQLLNSFVLTLRGPERSSVALRCVDLPGYGFAAAHKSIRESFAPMVEGYIAQRPSLRGLVLLVDVRRGLKDLDLQMMTFATERGLPTLLVGTKVDKVGVSELGLARRQLAEAVGARPVDVLLTSAQTGRGVRGPDGLATDLARLATEEPA